MLRRLSAGCRTAPDLQVRGGPSSHRRVSCGLVDGPQSGPRLFGLWLSYVRGRRLCAVGRRCRYRRAGHGSLVTASLCVVLPVPTPDVVAAWVIGGALPFLHLTPARVAVC